MISVIEEEWHRHPILYSFLAVVVAVILLAVFLVLLNDLISYVRSLT